jgi:5'-3' exonuclease
VLSGKVIVIDVSIYIYKYLAQNALQENFYQMITLFRKYNIKPLFVFDGKPPPEKMDLLQKRHLMKIDAESKYKTLNDELSNVEDEELRENILQDMEQLRKQFIRVKEKDINSIKEIMDAYGVMYYNAQGEADKTCAVIQQTKQFDCFGCLSDDMDMFVYGCSFVIRHLSLVNETVLIYNKNEIMNDLNMTFPIFKQVAILSGTDYNSNDNDTSLYETLKWYREFEKTNSGADEYVFYKWLYKNTKYIKDYDSLIEIHNLFNLDIVINDISSVNLNNYDKFKLQEVMSKYGFVFV